MDSNSRSPVSGDTPQRPRIASPGIISAKSRLVLRTKGFDPLAEILRASPESHRFLAKVPAPRRRDTPLPAFRKMRVQASGNLFPAYQKRGEPDRRQMADMLIMHAVEALIIMPATRESSEDLREGLEAFGAKRKPRFRGNDVRRGDSRSLRGVAADGGPRVRIHLPPPASLCEPEFPGGHRINDRRVRGDKASAAQASDGRGVLQARRAPTGAGSNDARPSRPLGRCGALVREIGGRR
jgi:hypothetical protein